MKFKGISIQGNIKTFVKRLEKKGFDCDEPQNGACDISGKVADIKIRGTVKYCLRSKKVFELEISLWGNDVDNSKEYSDRFPAILANKYGEPSFKKVKEDPNDPDDWDVLYEFIVGNDKIVFSSSCFVGPTFRYINTGNVLIAQKEREYVLSKEL